MNLPQSFKDEYAETASAFARFISHREMERYHPVNWAMRLDKALGMPWTLYRITHSVAIRFSFSGAALNMQPDGLRFAPPRPAPSVYDAKMYDNLARFEAARKFHGFKGVSWHCHDLRGYITGRLPVKRDPDFVPAMMIDDLDNPPSAQDWQRHIAEHRARLAERDREDAAMIAHVTRHDPAQVTGTQAFYADIRLHIAAGLADPEIPADFRAYYDWLLRYADLRAAGKTDADILPLRLDYDFDELKPASAERGPAP